METQNSDEWLASHVQWVDTKEKPVSAEIDTTGFKQFVDELKSNLHVDEGKLRKPPEGVSFENSVVNWMSFVTGENDLEKRRDQPPVVGRIKASDRAGEIEIIPGFTKRAKDLYDEKSSRTSRLYSVALAQAKLEMIEDLMGDVYPSLEAQGMKYKEYLNTLKADLLNPAEADAQQDMKSLAQDTFAISKRLRLTFVSTMVLTGILIAGCGGTQPETGINVNQPLVVQAAEVPVVPEIPVVPEMPAQSADESELPTAEHVEELIAGGGTAIEESKPNLVEYIAGESEYVSMEPIAGTDQLPADMFVRIGSMEELKTKSGKFIYVSKKQEGNNTIYQIAFFTNPDVVAYTSTIVDQLNMFQMMVDEENAQESMWKWCDDRLAESTESNRVICFRPPKPDDLTLSPDEPAQPAQP